MKTFNLKLAQYALNWLTKTDTKTIKTKNFVTWNKLNMVRLYNKVPLVNINATKIN